MHASERMFKTHIRRTKKRKGLSPRIFLSIIETETSSKTAGIFCRFAVVNSICRSFVPVGFSVQLFQKEQRIPVRIIVLNGKLFPSDEFEAHFPVEFVRAVTDGR